MTFRNFLDKLEEWFLVWSLAASVLLVFAQIIMRYVFRNSLSWSEELTRYLFLWMSWVGASYAVRHGSHFRVGMLADLLKGRARDAYEVLVLSVWLGFSVFLTYQGGKICLFQWQRGQISSAMEIPMALAYASVPAGCALMTLRLLIGLNDLVVGFFQEKKAV
ncbi:MAG: TRAP transporter small permease [Synergistaceae bacterium]|jgi:TRAP-type C4-dicarboxylate transport system permease small subunit|nr:TRAP transporter small permease [Synergistaceae bacterium]